MLRAHGGRTALEFKYDGARVQVHREGDRVAIWTRRLSDVTRSLPDVVAVRVRRSTARRSCSTARSSPSDAAGRPLPFQELMRRFRRVHGVEALVREMPLALHFFDCLIAEGRSLIDAPYAERWEALTRVTGGRYLAERAIVDDDAAAQAFHARALAAGHEGVMAKDLGAPYEPGGRGKRWFKLKVAETLDCVIVAADRGSGRRVGWLSNYHLAVRDGERLAEVGKTFKGLTDAEFAAMTERLRALAVEDDGYTVRVRPEVVVEVEYNEIQRSPTYPSGFALRFARIARIREDKAGGRRRRRSTSCARSTSVSSQPRAGRGRIAPRDDTGLDRHHQARRDAGRGPAARHAHRHLRRHRHRQDAPRPHLRRPRARGRWRPRRGARHERARRFPAAPRVRHAAVRLAARRVDAHGHADGRSVPATRPDERRTTPTRCRWVGRVRDFQVPTPDGGWEFDWNWKATYNHALYTVRPFLYFHFAAGSRRVVVDGVEPMDSPADSIQFYMFDELYRKTIHRDAETLGMEICLPVWQHREFIDAHLLSAHRHHHACCWSPPRRRGWKTCWPARWRRATSAPPPTPSWCWAASGSGSRLARMLCVVKHRGSAMSDEIVEYRVTDRGFTLG